tara:strand:- start:8 stop:508 length:501 start_codon:yes stop_codon:yes gene_type:complete
MKKAILGLVALLAFTTMNAQDRIGRTSLGLGVTEDFGIIATVDYINDNKTIAGFLIGMKNYADQYFIEIPYPIQKTETSSLTVAVRLGYEVLPKVSLISSTGITINKQVIDKNQLSVWGGNMPLQINDSSNTYSAVELRFDIDNNISFSWGYGSLGAQVTLNYSFK